MKLIHVPFCFRPEPLGGTEIYVDALAREQQQRGLQVVVAAPANQTTSYVDNGLEVRRFATAQHVSDLRDMYGSGDETASRAFCEILESERPDVVHLHAFTRAVSSRLAANVKDHGIPLVFTYHTPTVSCARGTLLHWGKSVCDGQLRVHDCARCALHGLGAAQPAAALVGSMPPALGDAIGRLGLSGGAWTGLRMTELLAQQHSALRSFLGLADRIVVLCGWAGDLLARNGVSKAKVSLSRHGLMNRCPEPVEHTQSNGTGKLRIAFLGRIHPTKGVDTLIRAVRALTLHDLRLDIFGVVQDESAADYAAGLRRLASGDSRIQFREPIPSEEVPHVLSHYDVLAVPSRWLETGPLVVLEAFDVGVPVVGSRLGGIAELVRDGEDGLLVAADSVTAWAGALGRLVEDHDLLARLRRGVQPPRRMDAVAEDMLALYQSI